MSEERLGSVCDLVEVVLDSSALDFFRTLGRESKYAVWPSLITVRNLGE